MNVANDQRWMQRAIELASCGAGFVEPNPQVGCVLVRDGLELGSGFHQNFGGDHAEVEALRCCNGDAAGATAYVNLEPCSHHGKTPPCADQLIEARVARVVIGAYDPFPQVAGRGIARLRAAGISVDIGVLENQSRTLNAPYFKRIATGLPWIIAKWAMTLDGKLATVEGDSKWISSEESRAVVHKLRGRVDAIMVGSRTVITDDPLLTARPPGPRRATRIVVDSGLQLPLESQLVTTANQHPTLIAAGPAANTAKRQQLVDAGCEVLILDGNDHESRLNQLLNELGRREMSNILVEGGAGLLGGLMDLQEIDEVHVFIGNRIAGGATAVSPIGGAGQPAIQQAWNLHDISHTIIAEDVYIHGRMRSADALKFGDR